MSYSYLGYEKKILTMPASGNVTQGAAVTMTANGAALPAANTDFIGVVDSVNKTFAGVQTEGYVECRYTGTAPTLGVCGLMADSLGYVTASADAQRKYRVLKLDTSRRLIGFIL